MGSDWELMDSDVTNSGEEDDDNDLGNSAVAAKLSRRSSRNDEDRGMQVVSLFNG